MSKIIVYSANIGKYDKFREPTIVDPNIEYYLFTDDTSIKSNVWNIINYKFEDKTLDNKKKSRVIKCNPHLILPEHDISIWIDANFLPLFDNAVKLLESIKFLDKNIMIYQHRDRKCLYQEAKVVKAMNYDIPEIIDNQMARYKEDGFPENYGLFESGFVIRKNNNAVNEFNELWWDEIKNNSSRDQLSQMYASWKTNVTIDRIMVGTDVFTNQFIGEYTFHHGKSMTPNWSMEKIMDLYLKKK